MKSTVFIREVFKIRETANDEIWNQQKQEKDILWLGERETMEGVASRNGW